MTQEEPKPLRLYRCPGCKKSTRYELTNPFRPFCCATCKNLDIIGWAEESFRIAGPEAQAMDGRQSPDDDEG